MSFSHNMSFNFQVDFDEMSVANRFVVNANVDAELDESMQYLMII